MINNVKITVNMTVLTAVSKPEQYVIYQKSPFYMI